jgi:drug/metabolite transporter (DMT)-like permease
MSQSDNQPLNSDAYDQLADLASPPESTQEVLDTMTNELERLRIELVAQLRQDLDRLQGDKSRLIQEITDLQGQRQQVLSQQQELVQQFSSVLVAQVQEILSQRLHQLLDSTKASREGVLPEERSMGLGSPTDYNDYSENAYKIIAALDNTLRSTFRSLQQDLNSYQSSLSQQIGQMYSLEQQGETIIESLVDRLRQEVPNLEAGSRTPNPYLPTNPAYNNSGLTTPIGNGSGYYPDTHSLDPYNPDVPNTNGEFNSGSLPDLDPDLEPEAEPEAPVNSLPPEPPKPPAPPAKPPASLQQIGLLLALLSSVALSLQNVVFRVMLRKSTVLGIADVGGFIPPGAGNSLLILWLRMLVVVPMMLVIGWVRYPNLFSDLRQFLTFDDKSRTWNTLGSGFFLFVSQVTIFLAFGQAPTGVVTTIFFIYPIITVLLAWLLFGDRPTLIRSLITATVFAGVVMISLPGGTGANFAITGVLLAVVSGIAFALYVTLTQAAQKKVHPVPFSVINFIIILLLSGFTLMLPLPEAFAVKVDPSMWTSIIITSIALGSLTLAGYLMTNIGIGMIGAAPFSVIGATGPALTSIMAFLIIQEALKVNQILGMLLVTIGVVALSVERLRSQKKPK